MLKTNTFPSKMHVFAVLAFSRAFWLHLERLGRLLEPTWASLGLKLDALGALEADLDALGANLDALEANLSA